MINLNLKPYVLRTFATRPTYLCGEVFLVPADEIAVFDEMAAAIDVERPPLQEFANLFEDKFRSYRLTCTDSTRVVWTDWTDEN